MERRHGRGRVTCPAGRRATTTGATPSTSTTRSSNSRRMGAHPRGPVRSRHRGRLTGLPRSAPRRSRDTTGSAELEFLKGLGQCRIDTRETLVITSNLLCSAISVPAAVWESRGISTQILKTAGTPNTCESRNAGASSITNYLICCPQSSSDSALSQPCKLPQSSRPTFQMIAWIAQPLIYESAISGEANGSLRYCGSCRLAISYSLTPTTASSMTGRIGGVEPVSANKFPSLRRRRWPWEEPPYLPSQYPSERRPSCGNRTLDGTARHGHNCGQSKRLYVPDFFHTQSRP